jgi:hypothetical protein
MLLFKIADRRDNCLLNCGSSAAAVEASASLTWWGAAGRPPGLYVHMHVRFQTKTNKTGSHGPCHEEPLARTRVAAGGRGSDLHPQGVLKKKNEAIHLSILDTSTTSTAIEHRHRLHRPLLPRPLARPTSLPVVAVFLSSSCREAAKNATKQPRAGGGGRQTGP